jgi:NADH-quinone oxidoreductase subunit C/D
MDIIARLADRFPQVSFVRQVTKDEIPTAWLPADDLLPTLTYLKTEVSRPYRTLHDLTAIDERVRRNTDGQPAGAFTVVYHLLSYERNSDLRLKVALAADPPAVSTVTGLWPSADWYEREVWEMFGIDIVGHPHLRRLLTPPWWEGHPLRKEHPSRATEMGTFSLSAQKAEEYDEAFEVRPDEWDFIVDGEAAGPTAGTSLLNLGPHHLGTHGPLRVILRLYGERIVDAAVDIGYHHRGAEKIGERQSWHTYIPYTDRVDYLGGVMNNLPYVLAVERLAGIEVSERAQVIRVMMAELFRISSHLVFLGTFAQDLGAMSPVFYAFEDRERLFDVVEAITGARMHPGWFRIGGVAQDLPEGWEGLVEDFVSYLPGRLREYDHLLMKNRILKARTVGVGEVSLDDAIDRGLTGPVLRACGMAWDLRKTRPYSGYERFSFEVPTAERGDCYGRALVHVEEMRQSLRIIRQCLDDMPSGPYKAHDPKTTPPPKERTLHDIETLIAHFLDVSWGPVVPPGEAAVSVEAAKGDNTYYLISDGGTTSYRTRIRTPSFAHLQVLPMLCRGLEVADLIAILGSLDFVMGDVDR